MSRQSDGISWTFKNGKKFPAGSSRSRGVSPRKVMESTSSNGLTKYLTILWNDGVITCDSRGLSRLITGCTLQPGSLPITQWEVPMPGPVCVPCKQEMRCANSDAMVNDPAAGDAPSTYWFSVTWHCTQCGNEISIPSGCAVVPSAMGRDASVEFNYS